MSAMPPVQNAAPKVAPVQPQHPAVIQVAATRAQPVVPMVAAMHQTQPAAVRSGAALLTPNAATATHAAPRTKRAAKEAVVPKERPAAASIVARKAINATPIIPESVCLS
jgi:hypothetical protein